MIDLVRRSRTVALCLFAITFAVASLTEWFMLSGRSLPAPITLSAGVLSGALTVTRQSRWGALIAIAVTMRTVFLFLNERGRYDWHFLLDVGGIVFVALMVCLAPLAIRRRRLEELAANQLVFPLVAGGAVGIGVLAMLRYATTSDPYPVAAAAADSLSLAIGFLLAGSPITVLGMRTHGVRPKSLPRTLFVYASIVAFTGATFVALAHLPVSVFMGLGPFSAAWIWIALITGIVMGLRTHTIGAYLAIMVAVMLSATAFFRGLDLPAPELLEATLNWQISALGLMLVLLSVNALVIGVRRASDQKRVEVGIIDAMLGRPVPAEEAPETDPARTREAFRDALSAVASTAEADTGRLYQIDPRAQTVTLVHAWPDVDLAAENPQPLRPVIGLFKRVMLGRGDQVGIGLGPVEDGVREALDALGLGDMRAAYLQPIVAGGKVIGAIAILSRTTRPFSVWDIEPLLSLIAEFYVVDRARDRARSSIGNYQRRLRELAARTALAEERVRRETAVELHDGLIQRLAVARMKLGELRHRAGDTGPVGTITDIVDETLAASRAIIHDLSPSVVYELGLIPGLEKLVDDLRTEGRFRLTLRQHGDDCPLEEPVRVGIYQVVQELVANSMAHSGGDRIWIDVYWEQTALDAVVVSDNGRGDAWWLAEAEADERSGLGLLSASERLRPIGYDIKFERRLGGGTRAILFWSSPAEG